jgi:hypothetical protein
MRVLDEQWRQLLGGIVAAGVSRAEFAASTPTVVARRLLTVIDGLSVYAVVGALPFPELTEIARDVAARATPPGRWGSVRVVSGFGLTTRNWPKRSRSA